MRVAFIAIVLVSVALALAGAVEADRGVGVSLGSIRVDEKLKPGASYKLPSIGVVNTGDERSEYELGVSHAAGQKQMEPKQAWFIFEPSRFALDGGAVQQVEVRLTLPTGADAGDYFAFLEARGVIEGSSGVGVAAATTLSFSVKHSSWIAAQRTQIERVLRDLEPWSYVVPALIIGLLLADRLRRSFRFRIERR